MKKARPERARSIARWENEGGAGSRLSTIGQTVSAGGSTVEIWTTPEEQMQIQTNTDSNITGSDSLTAQAKTVVEGALARFSDHITRVEIHLSDENGPRGGVDDIRCLMEARLEGRPPVAVTHQAATVEQALDGAAGKLKRSIESTLGRLRDDQ